jgi:Na+/proline symporter
VDLGCYSAAEYLHSLQIRSFGRVSDIPSRHLCAHEANGYLQVLVCFRVSSVLINLHILPGTDDNLSRATVQIILFATLAIELKRRAPNAHTFLEVIRARYGPATHGVFIVFGLMTNTLVTAMLLTGGSAVVTSLTGVPTVAACFLLPVGVVMYTIFGGIKATFLTDYVHTVMLIIIIFIFAFTAFTTSSTLGSPGKVYDLLVAAGEAHPVAGNAGGSYLTMQSTQGAVFFVINIVGNFGTVFVDNGYYNKAM